MPEMATISLKNTSFDLLAHIIVSAGGDDGVLICQGGAMAGWSLYVIDGKPTYTYNWFGHEITTVTSKTVLPAGTVKVGVSFAYDGRGRGKRGLARLLLNGVEVGSGRIERTVPYLFSMSGETLDVGIDTGSAVGPYNQRFPSPAQSRRSRSTSVRHSPIKSASRSTTDNCAARSQASETGGAPINCASCLQDGRGRRMHPGSTTRRAELTLDCIQPTMD
jgi:hypothetical protein